MTEKIYYRGRRHNGIKQDVHRAMMEEHLGRKLDRQEVVHHINGDKHDNRLGNLQVMTLSEHTRHHLSGKPLSEETKKKLSDSLKGRPRPDRWVVTRKQAEEAIARRKDGESWRSIGRSMNHCHQVIMRAAKRLEEGDIP